MGSVADKKSIPEYLRTGLLVGGVGFLISAFLMFFSMGIPIVSILLGAPVGIVTGRLLLRREKPDESFSKKTVIRAGFMAGATASLGIIIPLLALAIVTPKGATLSQEFSKSIDVSFIPPFLDNISVAMILGALVCALAEIGLAVGCCIFAVSWQKRGVAKNNR